MTEGQCNPITNDAPKMSSFYFLVHVIKLYFVSELKEITNTLPPYKQKPQGTKDVRIKFMFFSIFFIPI